MTCDSISGNFWLAASIRKSKSRAQSARASVTMASENGVARAENPASGPSQAASSVPQGVSAVRSKNVQDVEDSAFHGPQPHRSRPRGPKKRANEPRKIEPSLLGDPSRMKSCGEPTTTASVVEDSAWSGPEESLISDCRQPSGSNSTAASTSTSVKRASPREVTSGTSPAKGSSTNGKGRKRTINAYNKFCRDHKELGLSSCGLSKLYKLAIAGSYTPNLTQLNEWRGKGTRFSCQAEDFVADPKNFSPNFPTNSRKKSHIKSKSNPEAGRKVETDREGESNADVGKEEVKAQAKSTPKAEKKQNTGGQVESTNEETEDQAVSSTEKEAEKNGAIENEAPVVQEGPSPSSSSNQKGKQEEDPGEKPDARTYSNRKPNRWNLFQAMFSGWEGSKIKEAYNVICKGFDGEVVNAILGIETKKEGCSFDEGKKTEATKVLQGYKGSHESDMVKRNAEKKPFKKGGDLDSDQSLSPEEIRVKELSRIFRKPMVDLRKQNREKLPHNHDRLFKKFSAWMLVSPTEIRRELPKEEGVYEWGFKIPKGKEITCFYLGKATNLRTRVMKYIDPKRNQVVGPKEDHDGIKQKYFQELSARGCSFYVRHWKTTNAKEIEEWLLGQVNYGLNKVNNGEKRAVEMEGGRHFPDVQ